MGSKNIYTKIISAIMVSVFAILIIIEIAGIQIHHDESIGLVGVFSLHSSNEKAGRSPSEIPCQKDETPIEHVIHNGARNISTDNAKVLHLDQAILPDYDPSSFQLSSLLKINQERSPLPLYLSSISPNRAPPTYL